ncbi:flippase [Nitrosococcus halophilus]|uniref:flippase n=1 Tax=Nitrosococcus halophilus TaxID=133539 RepID=UPI00031F9087|nr:flippase [Nitrosococcus halophilus]
MEKERSFSQSKKVDTAARVIKNSAALFTASLFAKGGGLIVAVLVARYLDPSSLGIYGIVLALALLFEIITPFGQQDVVVRAIARDQSLMFTYWVNASVTTILFALGFGVILASFAHLMSYDERIIMAVYVAAIGLPVAGLYLIAQAVLQGLERMEHLVIAAFIGRVLGLFILWILLVMGVGIWSAFVGRIIFQLTSFLILSWVILQQSKQVGSTPDWRPKVNFCQAILSTAVPFALQRFLTESLARINIIILPMIVALDMVGIFNGADRVSQTSASIIPVVMMSILPVFSRSFKNFKSKSGALISQTLKFLFIVILPFVFIVTAIADKIILLLYGPGYEASVQVLQVIIWSQVFFAADMVMKQSMIANDNERAMVWRSALGTIMSIALTVVLGKMYGLFGISIAIVVASVFVLILDASFVLKYITKIDLAQAAYKPFLCALLSGAVSFSLTKYNLFILLLITATAYIIALLLFKAFSAAEMLIMRQLFYRAWGRIIKIKG